MKVQVYPFRDKVSSGNIIWASRFPMRGGKFPASHPCGTSEGAWDGGQIGDGDNIKAFRARGYWASCFPEGDGITWKPMNGQSDEQAVQDIRECFGWEIETPTRK